MVSTINPKRRDRRLNRFTIDAQLTRVTRAWTHVGRPRRLDHDPNHVTPAKRDSRRVGENGGDSTQVGCQRGAAVGRMNSGFMAAVRHRINILRDYNRIGIGVTLTRNGHLWSRLSSRIAAALDAPAGLRLAAAAWQP